MSRKKKFQIVGGLVLACFLLPALGPAQEEEVAYTMPPGWVMHPVQGAGPDVKAHYVFYQGGIPYCELYVICEPLTQSLTLDQAFQQGLDKVKPTLQYYRPLGTQKIQIAGREAVVHDFSYLVGGSVFFNGRSYALLVKQSLYNFFFNSAASYFPYVSGGFNQILNTVRVTERSLAQDVQMTAALPAAQAGGMTVEEKGFVFDLGAGWSLSNDSAGAKYRLRDAAGRLLGSFFVFESDAQAAVMSLLGVPNRSLLQSALEKSKSDLFQRMTNYAPLQTAETRIGGQDALLHDFNFSQGNVNGFYRWCFIACKAKADTTDKKFGTNVYQFAFMTTALDQLEALKSQFQAIINSFRIKGAASAVFNPPQPAQGPTALPAKNLPEQTVKRLPELAPAPQPQELYRDAAGRFEIPLPPETQPFRSYGHLVSYKHRENSAYIQIWGYDTFKEAAGTLAYATQNLKLNGKKLMWNVAGKEALVGLYTVADMRPESEATVAVIYPEVNLVILVLLPVKEYEKSQEWIIGLIKGIRFLK